MKLLGIYPGNFQPPTRAHFQAYKKLRQIVGSDTFIITTDRTPTPDAPLNVGDKEQIWVRHGVPANNIQKVQDWKNPVEIFNNFSADQTAVIFALNQNEVNDVSRRKTKANQLNGKLDSEMGKQTPGLNELATITGENPEREVWTDSGNKPGYFQPYKGNETFMKPLKEHGYVIVIDDSKIEGRPVSTANIRQGFGSPRYTDNEKKKFFRFVFGWFDIGMYSLMTTKFKLAHQVAAEEEPPIAPDRNKPMVVPQNRVPTQAFKENITKLVHEILREIMDEDYSSTMSSTSSSDGTSPATDMATSLDQKKTADQEKSDTAASKVDLIRQKKELELKAKQNKQQRDSYATTVKNYDTFQKKTDRDALDAMNKQLSQPIQPTSPIA